MSYRSATLDCNTFSETLPPAFSSQEQHLYFARFYVLRLSIWRQNILNDIECNSNLIFSCGSEMLKKYCTAAQFTELQILERILVERNLRLAAKLVFDPCFSGYRQEQEICDLVQTAFLGLYPAVIRYDFKRNVPFSSFARFWIKKYIYKQGSVKTYKGHRFDIQLFNYDLNTTFDGKLYLCKKTAQKYIEDDTAAYYEFALSTTYIQTYAYVRKQHNTEERQKISSIKNALFTFIRNAKIDLNKTYENFLNVKTQEAVYLYRNATKKYLRVVRWSIVLNAIYDLELPLQQTFGICRTGTPKNYKQLLKFFSITKQALQLIKVQAINALKRVLHRNAKYT